MKNSTLLFGFAALLSVTNALSQTLAERQVITANYDQQALTLLEDALRKDIETNQRIRFARDVSIFTSRSISHNNSQRG